MISLADTGKLTFSWSNIQNIDGYYINLIKNKTNQGTLVATGNSFYVSGLIEGDEIGGIVYPYSGSHTFVTGIELTSQSVPVTNFNELGSTLDFGSMIIDGSPSVMNSSSSGYYFTGSYIEGSSFLDFSILSPRSGGSNIEHSFQEPFFSGVSYKVKNNDSVVESNQINGFNFIFNNSYESRNLELEIIAHDVYGSGVMSNIYLNNDPISISNLNVYLDSSSVSGSGIFQIVPSFDSLPKSIDYVLLNKDKTNILISGNSLSPYNTTGFFPLDTTGFLELTPYDWYGSGFNYVKNDPIFFQSSNYIPENNIKYFYSTNDTISSIDLLADYNKNNDIGSYFKLSIDSNSETSFSSDSYFTGILDYVGETTFDYFNLRTGVHEEFYYNLELIQSGTNSIEESSSFSNTLRLPHFITSGVLFDYENGLTTASFSTFPNFIFTGIDILYSGFEDSDYVVYSGQFAESNDLHFESKVKVVDSLDHSKIYDSLFISGSGETPLLTAYESNDQYLDATNNFNFDSSNQLTIIDSINVYRKPVIGNISGELSPNLSGLLEFNDYPDYQLSNITFGFYSDSAPFDIQKTSRVQLSGDYSGSYDSGRHYAYRFEPVNAYNTGNITPAIISKFIQNPIANGVELSQLNFDSTISEISARTYSVSIVAPTGIYKTGINFNDIGNFNSYSTEPQIVTSIENNPNLPFIYDSSTDGISKTGFFVNFSDRILSTGYFINIIVEKIL